MIVCDVKGGVGCKREKGEKGGRRLRSRRPRAVCGNQAPHKAQIHLRRIWAVGSLAAADSTRPFLYLEQLLRRGALNIKVVDRVHKLCSLRNTSIVGSSMWIDSLCRRGQREIHGSGERQKGWVRGLRWDGRTRGHIGVHVWG